MGTKRVHVSGWLDIDDEAPEAGPATDPAATTDPAPLPADPNPTPAVEPGPVDIPTPAVPAGEPGPEPLDPTAPAEPVDAAPVEPVDTGPGDTTDPFGVDTEPNIEPSPEPGPATLPTTEPTPGQEEPGAEQPAAGTGPAWPGRELRRNDRQARPDDDVRTWQQAATDAGFGCGPVDGFFGPRTESGVIAVQAAAGVAITGVIDAATWPLAWSR